MCMSSPASSGTSWFAEGVLAKGHTYRRITILVCTHTRTLIYIYIYIYTCIHIIAYMYIIVNWGNWEHSWLFPLGSMDSFGNEDRSVHVVSILGCVLQATRLWTCKARIGSSQDYLSSGQPRVGVTIGMSLPPGVR